ncbi:MAG: hypothetical protein ACJA0S_000162 [Rickettsiales bacterium]|jgi:hypothetical protein
MTKDIESRALDREMKAGIRKEKIVGHLRANQKIIIFIVSAMILISATYGSWAFYSQMQSEKYSKILHQATIDEQNGNMEKSFEALKSIYESNSPAGVKSIASIKYATKILDNGDANLASEVYLEINKNKKFDQYIREYAGLSALKILINENKSADEIHSLAEILEKNSNILKYYIIEQKGNFEWNSGNFDAANKIFSSLAGNPEIENSLKKRASEMVDIYESKFGKK